MGLISVTEYAVKNAVSRQSVYARIKSGALKCVVKEGNKYIEIQDVSKDIDKTADNESKANDNVADKALTSHIKSLKKEVRYLKDQLKELERSKDKEYSRLEKLFDTIMSHNIKEIPIIDAEIVKKKKKKH